MVIYTIFNHIKENILCRVVIIKGYQDDEIF